jgi:hypothetical protein
LCNVRTRRYFRVKAARGPFAFRHRRADDEEVADMLAVALEEARQGSRREFGISRLVAGEARTFHGRHEWPAAHGVEVEPADDPECVALMTRFIEERPEPWHEDIGVG